MSRHSVAISFPPSFCASLTIVRRGHDRMYPLGPYLTPRMLYFWLPPSAMIRVATPEYIANIDANDGISLVAVLCADRPGEQVE